MCGIFGIYDEKNKNLIDKCKIGLDIIKYRGPDKSIFIKNNDFIGGTNRLAIEALKNGDQPVENDDCIIGFNGEIFNYKKLITKFNFKSNVDSEVKLLINLWMLKGIKFIDDLEGQFAIFIYEKKTKKIFLIRDRYGIRPIFYFFDQNSIYFGSEIKSIVSTLDKEFEIDSNSLNQTAFFWTNIGKQTAIKDIYSVQAGSYLEYQKGTISEKKYFTNHIINENYSTNNYDQIKKDLLKELKDSISRQSQSEVGYACYLSGGIDSAIIAYLLSEKKKLDTFSIEFDDEEYNEKDSQNKLIKIFNSRHKSLVINKEDISKNFMNVINHSECFLFRTAPVPLYLLSKLVNKSGHKVVYTGEGADEILYGYDIFFENRIRNYWKKNPKSKLRPYLLRKLYNYLPQFKDTRYFELIKDFYRSTLTVNGNPYYSHLARWAQYHQIISYFNIKPNESKLLNEFKQILPKNFEKLSSDTRTQQIEIDTLLTNYLLSSQGDRMSMANSVEGRYPYLDDQFTKFCSEIDPTIKAFGIRSKTLLRDTFKEILPKEIINRPKIAYQAPEAQSFLGYNYTTEIFENFMDNINNLELINKNNFLGLIEKIKNPLTSKRLGFRENVAFILGLSYFTLKDKISNWKNFKYENKNNS